MVTWLIIFVFIMIVSNIIGGPDGMAGRKIAFSDFMKKVETSQVIHVSIKGNDLIGTLKDNSKFYTYLPDYPDLIAKLQSKGIQIDAIPLVSKSEKIISGILGFLPFVLMIGLWLFIAKGMASSGNKAMGFGKSKAKLLQENKTKVTFADVAGIDEAKQELSEIVDFLKDSQKYTDLGARIPRGCLLIGSPGTGKTLLARAIAGESGVPFFSISGSDFVEMLLLVDIEEAELVVEMTNVNKLLTNFLLKWMDFQKMKVW